MPDYGKELQKLRTSIDDAKEQKSKLEGMITANMERLAKDYKLHTVKEAQQYTQTLDKKIVNLEDRLEKGIQRIQNEFNKEDMEE